MGALGRPKSGPRVQLASAMAAADVISKDENFLDAATIETPNQRNQSYTMDR
jgi:hypothetical protein